MSPGSRWRSPVGSNASPRAASRPACNEQHNQRFELWRNWEPRTAFVRQNGDAGKRPAARKCSHMSIYLPPQPADVAPIAETIQSRLPGGGHLTVMWSSTRTVTVSLAGELDAFDRHALVDALSGVVLCGADDILIDATRVSFADTEIVGAIDQVCRHLRRIGGALTVVGFDTLPVARSLHLRSTTRCR